MFASELPASRGWQIQREGHLDGARGLLERVPVDLARGAGPSRIEVRIEHRWLQEDIVNRAAPDLQCPTQNVVGLVALHAGDKLLFDNLFNSDVVLKSGDNDNRGPVEGIIDESIQGTSFASAHIAGAGALVRDYFAQGFYPRGKALVEDRIPIISGSLTRSLLTASGNFLTAFIRNPDRFNNEQGVGRVELSNVFPLVNFHGGPVPDDPRRALRPSGSSPDTFPTIPTSLLVFDEFFEGGQTLAKNGAGLATGVAVLEEGVTTLTSAFRIMETNEQLRVSLSWYDPASPLDGGGSLSNDLDLELESPSGLVYRGNNFSGEFSVDTSQGDTQVDTRNPVELVILDRPEITFF